MSSPRGVVVIVFVGLLVSSCGVSNALSDGAFSLVPRNREACLRFVDAANALECVSPGEELFDPEGTCPGSLDQPGVDCTRYYACLEEALRCQGSELVMEDTECFGCDAYGY